MVSQAILQHRRRSSTYDRNVKLIADFANGGALGPSQSVNGKCVDDEMAVAFGGGGRLLKLDDGNEGVDALFWGLKLEVDFLDVDGRRDRGGWNSRERVVDS